MLKKMCFGVLVNILLVQIVICQSSLDRIAILNLDAVSISNSESITLTDRLRSELVNSGSFTVIERSEMDEILKEQGFQQAGCTSDECAVEIGKLLNINTICAGSVGKIGSLYTVTLRMIDVETGQILTTVTEDCQCPIEQVLTTSMKNISRKLITASKAYVSPVAGGKGDIYLKSNPSAATIYVDGKKTKKTTPSTIRDLESGEHLVKVVKGDYVGSKVIRVHANDITEDNIILGKAKGGLKAYSTPAEAKIYIGNKFYGNTPKIISDLSAGDHLVVLKKSGYMEVKRRVSVKGDQFATVDAEMVKPAALYLSSLPSNASVIIRGQDMGKTPLNLTDLYPEKVYVEVLYPGYQTERRYVQLREAFSTNERFELKKLPSLHIDSNPSGARVYINEKFHGMTPVNIDALSEDRAKVVVKKNYYDDWTQNLVLQAGRDEKVNANLKIKQGNVKIISSPEKADVVLEGKKIGTTPINKSINYGEYSISISNPKFETISEKLIIDQPNIEQKYKLSFKKGHLILNNLIPGSSVIIDGLKTKQGSNEYKVPIGIHKVKIEKSGYEGKTLNYISKDNQSKTFNGSLSRKTNGNALWRSLLLPGWGQAYQEKSVQTWLYPILVVGGIGGSYLTINSYNTAVDDYDKAREKYLSAFTVEDITATRTAMDKAYDDVESAESTRNIMFITTGAIWIWNVLDTVILPAGYKNKMTLSTSTKNDEIKLGLVYKW